MKQTSRRLTIAMVSGAILGIFCIIGMTIRQGFVGNELFILATWTNRVLMGIVIGLAPYIDIRPTTPKILLRGAILGLIVGGSFYLSTSFKDTPGLFAGIIYGMIIDLVSTRYSR